MIRRAVDDLRPYRRYAFGVLGCTLAYAVGRVIPPLLGRVLLDDTLRGRPAVLWSLTLAPGVAVVALPLAVAAVAAVLAAAQHLMRTWMGVLGQRFVGDLQVRLFHHLLRLPTTAMERRSLGRQMTRFAGDMTSLRRFVTRSIPELLRDGVTVTAIVAVLITLHPPLGLVVAMAVTTYLGLAFVLWRRLRPASRVLRSERGRIAGMVLDRLAAASVVKMMRQERREAVRLARAQDVVVTATRRAARLSGLLGGSAELAVGAALALTIGVGGHEVLAGALTRGELLAAYGLVLLLVSPLRTLGRTAEALAQGSVALERLYTVLERAPEGDGVGARPLAAARGELSLAGLRSRRWGREVRFPDLDLHPGVTALVGGSGKSHLGHWLVGLDRPEAGQIAIDGTELSQFALKSLRRAVMYIPQPPTLLKGTVRRNLRAGLRGVTEAEMLAALWRAGAEWAEPAVLAEKVGGGGWRLSPRQRWQILCARALLARPSVLVLEEPPVGGPALTALLQSFVEGGVRTIVLLVDHPPAEGFAGQTIVLEEQRAVSHA